MSMFKYLVKVKRILKNAKKIKEETFFFFFGRGLNNKWFSQVIIRSACYEDPE